MTFACSSSLIAASLSPEMEQAGYPTDCAIPGKLFSDLMSGASYSDQGPEGVAKMGSTYLFRLASGEPVFHFPKKNPRRKTGAAAKEILTEWANTHLSNLYPNAAERGWLLDQTGITTRQLNSWLGKFRERREKLKRKAAAALGSGKGPKQKKLSF
jgi:hypothetical protein